MINITTWLILLQTYSYSTNTLYSQLIIIYKNILILILLFPRGKKKKEKRFFLDIDKVNAFSSKYMKLFISCGAKLNDYSAQIWMRINKMIIYNWIALNPLKLIRWIQLEKKIVPLNKAKIVKLSKVE